MPGPLTVDNVMNIHIPSSPCPEMADNGTKAVPIQSSLPIRSLMVKRNHLFGTSKLRELSTQHFVITSPVAPLILAN